MPRDGWIGVLSVVRKYSMARAKERAIREINAARGPWNPVQRWQTGRDNCIDGWMRTGIKELAEKESMPSQEDCEKLGAEATREVFQRREQRLRDLIMSRKVKEAGSAGSLKALNFTFTYAVPTKDGGGLASQPAGEGNGEGERGGDDGVEGEGCEDGGSFQTAKQKKAAAKAAKKAKKKSEHYGMANEAKADLTQQNRPCRAMI
jgi:hypothetical protein